MDAARSFLLPVDDVEVKDTWHVDGMAATGQPRHRGHRRRRARAARVADAAAPPVRQAGRSLPAPDPDRAVPLAHRRHAGDGRGQASPRAVRGPPVRPGDVRHQADAERPGADAGAPGQPARRGRLRRDADARRRRSHAGARRRSHRPRPARPAAPPPRHRAHRPPVPRHRARDHAVERRVGALPRQRAAAHPPRRPHDVRAHGLRHRPRRRGRRPPDRRVEGTARRDLSADGVSGCAPGDTAAPLAGSGSRGRPRDRSPRMLRWISSVPPAIDCAGTETRISARTPPSGLCGSVPASIASAPPISAWTRAAWRATWLSASLPIEPSGPGGRPAARAALARSAVHSLARCIDSSAGDLLAHDRIVPRPSGPRVVDDEVDATGALRVPRVDLGDAPPPRPRASSRAGPSRGRRTGPRPGRRSAARGRGWPAPRSSPLSTWPTTQSFGMRASVRNTSLNERVDVHLPQRAAPRHRAAASAARSR